MERFHFIQSPHCNSNLLVCKPEIYSYYIEVKLNLKYLQLCRQCDRPQNKETIIPKRVLATDAIGSFDERVKLFFKYGLVRDTYISGTNRNLVFWGLYNKD